MCRTTPFESKTLFRRIDPYRNIVVTTLILILGMMTLHVATPAPLLYSNESPSIHLTTGIVPIAGSLDQHSKTDKHADHKDLGDVPAQVDVSAIRGLYIAIATGQRPEISRQYIRNMIYPHHTHL